VHCVVPGDLLILQKKADRGRHASLHSCLHVAAAQPVAATIVAEPLCRAFSLRSLGIELLPGAEAPVRLTLYEEALGIGLVTGGVLSLEEWTLVPGDAQPGQAIQYDPRMLGRAALSVGVLDPEDVRAARVARKQPVEERRASAPDVEIAGG
jgi:hypothetical protein